MGLEAATPLCNLFYWHWCVFKRRISLNARQKIRIASVIQKVLGPEQSRGCSNLLPAAALSRQTVEQLLDASSLPTAQMIKSSHPQLEL
jgi:hypothetical protein